MASYPAQKDAASAACNLADAFKDQRGTIQPLVDAPFNGCAVITSKKGAIRANHYHLKDWHYSYVLSGSLAYYHRPCGESASPTREVFKAGDMFYSPPMVEHSMEFLEETVFIVLSGLPREHEDYEADVVRIPDLTRL